MPTPTSFTYNFTHADGSVGPGGTVRLAKTIGPAKAAIAALGATAGTGLLAATTGGVFLGDALLAALSGIVKSATALR